MAKYKRTLQEVIDSFPEKYEVILSDFLFNRYRKDMTYEEKIQIMYNSPNNNYECRKVVFTKKDNHLYICFDCITLKRVGKNIFPTCTRLSSIYITNRTVSCNGTAHCKYILEALYSTLGIKDLESEGWPNCREYFRKPAIIKDILIGKIYGQETFYKDVMSTCFKLKDVNWRVFRDYISHGDRYSIFDLKEFTVNTENSMRFIIDTNNHEIKTLIRDALHNAVQLNEKIDLHWSVNRLREEHKRQNELLIQRELDKKDNKPIYEGDLPQSDTIEILNDEKRIFLEGKNMHHCLYNCYFRKIKEHNYMAWHMTTPEDCTFSVRRTGDGDFLFDQIYLAYDRSVEHSTRDLAIHFVNEHAVQIKTLLNGKCKNMFGE